MKKKSRKLLVCGFYIHLVSRNGIEPQTWVFLASFLLSRDLILRRLYLTSYLRKLTKAPVKKRMTRSSMIVKSTIVE